MTASSAPDPAGGPIGERSAWRLGLFTRYLRHYLRRNFHALRVARAGWPVAAPGQRLIICTNHPSWWDPALFILLMPALFPDRQGYGPMDAAALARYRLFRRFGIFGVEAGPQGARDFLQTGLHILDDPRRMLWITAQGGFADPRTRPVILRPGIAHLARRVPGVTVLPMAMEYPFWNERFPEALVRFGAPIALGAGARTAAWQDALQAGLTETMDALAIDAAGRDAAPFRTLLGGRAGIGGVYDRYRQGKAWLAGQTFDPRHEADAA